ncbi:hypothetical protein IAG25_15630 [Caballeronia sp. EK]|uniref:DUF5677 domain-containing protein n=1 Tax=Caballeronia sp. EK TaxID=2767469 RepID=UPI00165587FA|nr:DUF5677 domain-containing protein [Caballeronia sp. EK]MBC8638252.1 hypothetical protein [Caballeronia sp. EK]
MPDLKEVHETANAIIGMFDRELLPRIIVQADNDAAKMSACLTLSMFEQFHAAMKLSRLGLASHAAGPIRSMLDGLGDLLNLSRDPAYLDSMKLYTAQENGKLFNELLGSKNIDDDMRRTLETWVGVNKPIVAELLARQVRTFGLKDKLKKVDVEPMYVSYRVLCAFVHSNATTLLQRHDSGASPVLEYRAAIRPEVVVMLHNLAVDYLIRCVNEIPKFSTGVSAEEVDTMTTKAVAMWREVAPAPEGE